MTHSALPCRDSVRPLLYTDPMKTQPDNSGREMESGPVLLHGADSPPLMVHLEAEPEGCHIGLCGAQLHGIDAEEYALDCIVCAEIGRAMGYEE